MLPSRQGPNAARGIIRSPSRPVLRCLFCAAGIFRAVEETLEDAVRRSNLLINLCSHFELVDTETRIPSSCYRNTIPICRQCTLSLERFLVARHEGAERDQSVALGCIHDCFKDGDRLGELYPAIRTAMEAHPYAYLRTLLNAELLMVSVFPVPQRNQRLSATSQRVSGIGRGLMSTEQPEDLEFPADYLVLDPPTEDTSLRMNASAGSSGTSQEPEPPTGNLRRRMEVSRPSGSSVVSRSRSGLAMLSELGPIILQTTVRTRFGRSTGRYDTRRRN